MPAAGNVLIYADGGCIGNPGPGGWGVVFASTDGAVQSQLSGSESKTTNNRMELTAAIEGLKRTAPGAHVTLRSDSQYLINTMTRGWKRKANHDLWRILDSLANERHVTFEWVRGHAGDQLNGLADELANSAARQAARNK